MDSVFDYAQGGCIALLSYRTPRGICDDPGTQES